MIEAPVDTLSQMQVKNWSLMVNESFEISECQGEIELSKGVARAGDGKIFERVGSEDDEEALRGTTFVDLPE